MSNAACGGASSSLLPASSMRGPIERSVEGNRNFEIQLPVNVLSNAPGTGAFGVGSTVALMCRVAIRAVLRATVCAHRAAVAGEMFPACNNVKSLKCPAVQHETDWIIDSGLP
ncbi:MAG: hypothetical protein KGQ57_16675 [Burkholderiales bacterium]|nr:hypothetical protein [Burkholderiales bacterium]